MKLMQTVVFSASLAPILVLSAAAHAGSSYPTVARAVAVPTPIYRPCTQLERSAGIAESQCGSMTLSQVVATKAENDSDEDE
ncbi:hypothetical protein [Pseudoruegeria sp. HB172150]|uniref:hypothetical protein n=1 Tax=Pseudoruegeria sp. HB172150 TaxID=2721164 RepID=UPI001553BD9B|nr:hypothetical protein [Pseudoruegeria sp. HB172150]